MAQTHKQVIDKIIQINLLAILGSCSALAQRTDSIPSMYCFLFFLNVLLNICSTVTSANIIASIKHQNLSINLPFQPSMGAYKIFRLGCSFFIHILLFPIKYAPAAHACLIVCVVSYYIFIAVILHFRLQIKMLLWWVVINIRHNMALFWSCIPPAIYHCIKWPDFITKG